MVLAEQRGLFLYQIRPDLIPHGYLTPLELDLWSLYFKDKQNRG